MQKASYQYLNSENSTSSTHRWSFCSYHFYVGSLPTIPVLSHYTLRQSASHKIPGVSSWFYSPLVTCSISFSSYSEARTTQNKNQKGPLKKRSNRIKNCKSTEGKLQASTWALSHHYSKRGRVIQSAMEAIAAVCCWLCCSVIGRQRILHILKWICQSEITKQLCLQGHHTQTRDVSLEAVSHTCSCLKWHT